MAKIYLNIGANIGQKEKNIERAIDLIALAWPDAGAIRLAPLVTSAPHGFDSENMFYNLGMMIDTGKDDNPTPEKALAILDTLRHIEQRISQEPHRNADGTYRDREIDIDIMAIEGLEMDTPRLRLPHPGLSDRKFFIDPYRFLSHTPDNDI